MEKRLYAFAAALVLCCSCSLDEELTSYATAETYYTNEQEIITGLNGCYLPMRQIFGAADFFLYSEASTDIMYLNNSSYYVAVCDYSPTKSSLVSNAWQRGYLGVMRSNAIYAAIRRAVENGYITEKAGHKHLAEAAILRAMYYYLLTSSYGDVPFYTEEVTDKNRERIARLPRMSASDTRKYLIKELMDYLMPSNHATHPGLGAMDFVRTYHDDTQYRMGAAAGLMLAGKLAMWEKQWDEVIAALGVVEDIYGSGAGIDPVGSLARYPLSDIPFSRKYTAESIWELAYSYNPYGLQVPGVLATYTTPPRRSQTVDGDDDTDEEYVVTDVYNGIGIPELGNTARLAVPVRPSRYYYQNLMYYNSGDRRRAKYDSAGNEIESSGNLAWQWLGYDPLTDPHYTGSRKIMYFTTTAGSTGQPWLGNKFWCYDMIYTRDDNNPKVFRYAGALLCLAEAWMEKGDFAKACTYLNASRSRAGLALFSPGTFAGKDALREEIIEENARELFGEFQRRFELVRWGIWYERTTTYSGSPILLGNIKPYKEYLPIPSDQITYSGGALDNNAYLEN